ncbi:MAG: tetratricopeptide repeat protein [Elusimicrobiales bacterium]|jgi:tetratricopeptide (TPR) repeat protein
MKLRNELFEIGLCVLASLAAAGWTGKLYAGGSGFSSDWPAGKEAATPLSAKLLYDKGVLADKAGDDKTALDYFRQALKQDKKNPDMINMLAHSERKLGMLNEAITDYWTALSLRPRFPEAREYMGEAYIQAALKEMETLKSYGKAGEQQRKDLIKAFKDAAEAL